MGHRRKWVPLASDSTPHALPLLITSLAIATTTQESESRLMINSHQRTTQEDDALLGPEEEEHPTGYGTTPTPPSCNKLILYFMAIHFLLAFTQIILVAPLIRLFENSLCLSFYNFPSAGVEESMCKLPQIQQPLATIRGWKSTLDTIPVLLVAIPLGKFADYYGRRKILALCLIGVGCSLVQIYVVCAFPQIFPLKLVWLSSISLLCGGGLNAASAFMWAYASETIPSRRRSRAFYYIFSAFYIAELISSFLAAITMEITPWLPCGMAIGSVILCLLLVVLTPHHARSSNFGTGVFLSHEVHESEEILRERITSYSAKSVAVDGLMAALASPQILLTIPVFLVGIFRYTTLDILIQYASVRFGLKISSGAMFYTETACVNILLFLIVIPQSTAYLQKRHLVRPQYMDLVLVRTSVLLMCLGCLVIALSSQQEVLFIGVSIFAAGFGSRVSALALVSYWISDDAKATLYAAINVLESLGHAIGDPSMQQLFAKSLFLSGSWQALPFFVAAALYFLAVVSTTFIRVDNQLQDHSHEENDIEE